MKTEETVVIPPPPGQYPQKRSIVLEKTTTQEETVEKKETVTEVKTDEHWETHHDRFLRMSCIFALVIWVLVIVLLSLSSSATIFDTFIGLSPVFFTIVVSYILVDKYHMESGFLMVFPFLFTGVLLLLSFTPIIAEGMDLRTLVVINMVFGLLFEAALVMHHAVLTRKPAVTEKKTEVVETTVAEPKIEKVEEIKIEEVSYKELVQGIEDKAKAINAVIGRVYSVKHGGDQYMRKKLRIDPMHYNEFSKARGAGRKKALITLLTKIKLALETIEMKESQVFTKQEVAKLKLTHEPLGNDKILDVLARNDQDPIKTYHKSAIEFCVNSLKKLETVKKPEVQPTLN